LSAYVNDRRREIVRHLSMDDIDWLLAASTDQKPTERLIFLKRIYKGATLKEAADSRQVFRHRDAVRRTLERGRIRTSHAELRGRTAPEARCRKTRPIA